MIRALLLLAALLSAALGWSLWRAERADSRADVMQARAESAEAYTRDLQAQVETERARVEALNDIASQHEADKREIETRTAALVADLRAGNVRLRREIGAFYTERLSRDSTPAGQPSDAAQRGAELVAAAVGVGAACDARQRALVNAYEAARQ